MHTGEVMYPRNPELVSALSAYEFAPFARDHHILNIGMAEVGLHEDIPSAGEVKRLLLQ